MGLDLGGRAEEDEGERDGDGLRCREMRVGSGNNREQSQSVSDDNVSSPNRIQFVSFF